MKHQARFWIRKNKNVQVRVGEKTKEKVVVFFRNSHVRYIDRKQFLKELINLDDLLIEIIIVKNWNRPMGTARLGFEGKYARFTNHMPMMNGLDEVPDYGSQ